MASTTIPAALAEKAPLVLSNWACPYVQRLTLALVHKGVSAQAALACVSSGCGAGTRARVATTACLHGWMHRSKSCPRT